MLNEDLVCFELPFRYVKTFWSFLLFLFLFLLSPLFLDTPRARVGGGIGGAGPPTVPLSGLHSCFSIYVLTCAIPLTIVVHQRACRLTSPLLQPTAKAVAIAMVMATTMVVGVTPASMQRTATLVQLRVTMVMAEGSGATRVSSKSTGAQRVLLAMPMLKLASAVASTIEAVLLAAMLALPGCRFPRSRAGWAAAMGGVLLLLLLLD